MVVSKNEVTKAVELSQNDTGQIVILRDRGMTHDDRAPRSRG